MDYAFRLYLISIYIYLYVYKRFSLIFFAIVLVIWKVVKRLFWLIFDYLSPLKKKKYEEGDISFRLKIIKKSV